jgi:NADPH:quinone reductase-like Zn-dependent oxidoreductase
VWVVKAALRYRYGGPEVVEVREVEKPVPGEGEVLVRVRAASVNRADLDWLKPRPGFVRLFLGFRRPRSPKMGWDVAGEVESAGPGVTRWQPGDAVMADLANHGGGTFAEYVSAPAEAFERIPEGMSFEESSTLPHSAVLALQGLRRGDGSTFKAGDRVLVVGASGNVGPFAVQIAKAMGAHVTGVASRSKVELVREIGADEVLDYDSVDYTRSGRKWDWILECDSHYSILAARRALNPGGVYVTLGGDSLSLLGSGLGGRLVSLFSDRWSGLALWWKPFNVPDVDRLKELIAEGKLRPVIDRTYPLDQVVEALRLVDEGRSRGKVVITVG